MKKVKTCADFNETHLWVEHIPGVKNITADKLSRYLPDPLAACTFPMQPNPFSCVQFALQKIADHCRKVEVQWERQEKYYKTAARRTRPKRKFTHYK